MALDLRQLVYLLQTFLSSLTFCGVIFFVSFEIRGKDFLSIFIELKYVSRMFDNWRTEHIFIGMFNTFKENCENQ